MAERPEPSLDLSTKAVLEARRDEPTNFKNRLASFEWWPFISGDCFCMPGRMSKAGFYPCPSEEEPDLARCYVCFKALSCWEPSDDPIKEHSRSMECAYVRVAKKTGELTVRDLLHLEKARADNRALKLGELYLATLDDAGRKVHQEMDKLRRKKR